MFRKTISCTINSDVQDTAVKEVLSSVLIQAGRFDRVETVLSKTALQGQIHVYNHPNPTNPDQVYANFSHSGIEYPHIKEHYQYSRVAPEPQNGMSIAMFKLQECSHCFIKSESGDIECLEIGATPPHGHDQATASYSKIPDAYVAIEYKLEKDDSATEVKNQISSFTILTQNTVSLLDLNKEEKKDIHMVVWVKTLPAAQIKSCDRTFAISILNEIKHSNSPLELI